PDFLNRLSRDDHVAHQVFFLDRELHRRPYRPARRSAFLSEEHPVGRVLLEVFADATHARLELF
ncbi:hypothetical protein, partial [Kitasatospora sp. NPDC057936]|uniref:hypothetical protein n=1 Tax=Kitasatospora sp. NPDC057936 TaxID=3346283 RepID=UPI0036DDBCCB